MTAPIDLRTSTNPADREIDALRARVEALEAVLKDLVFAVDDNDDDDEYRKLEILRVSKRARAALTPTPEPVKPAAPAPLEHEEFTALWRKVNTQTATIAEISIYRAECNRRASVLSDRGTSGKDERQGRNV